MNTLSTVIGSAISVLTLAPMVVVRIFLSDDPFASIFTVNVSYVEVEPCSNGVSNWINTQLPVMRAVATAPPKTLDGLIFIFDS